MGVLAQLARKTYLAYIYSDPNSACTQNTPGLHTQLTQLFMYVEHARPTYTIANYLCTRQVLIYPIGPINQRARPTPLAGPPNHIASQQKNNQRPAYMHNVREAFAAAPSPTPSAMPSAAPKASFKIPAQEKIRRTDKKNGTRPRAELQQRGAPRTVLQRTRYPR